MEKGRPVVVSKVGGFFNEFWAFAAKGNVIQLAIAVVVGNAFGAVVNSLVSNIITPLLSLLTNHINFNSWAYTLRQPTIADGTTTPAVVIAYGPVLQAAINFLIVGLSIFVIYKLLHGAVKRFQRQEEQEKKAEPPAEEKLLTEIRDILKEDRNRASSQQ